MSPWVVSSEWRAMRVIATGRPRRPDSQALVADIARTSNDGE